MGYLGDLARRSRALPVATALFVASASARADDALYKSHMDIGVKLYQDGNYDAAVVEFEAAYHEHPKAAPLLDEALCHKAKFRYPKAIAALERALAEHGGELDPADRKASEDAIVELRGLLGHVVVRVKPSFAEARVDGEVVRSGEPLDVGPGRHLVRATAAGFAPAEQAIEIATGDTRDVRLELASTSARVEIISPEPRATIAIDGREAGVGSWAGMLPVGPHTVSIAFEGRSFVTTFLAAAGTFVELMPGRGLPRALPITARPPPPPPPPTPPVAPHRGPYVVAAALFGVQSGVSTFSGNAPSGAAAFSGGYRLNNVIGLGVLFEYSEVSASGYTFSNLPQNGSMKFSSARFGANLRVTSRGTSFRFLSNAAVGAQYDSLSWYGHIHRSDVSGMDPFLRVEEGFEFDIGGVLIGSTLAEFVAAPMSLSAEVGQPVIGIGPSLHIGYGFW